MAPKRSALHDLVDSTPYLFYKDRLTTFKNFALDKDKNAVCTSEAIARAGFYCTGTISAKCSVCLKELEFEAEDDPWEEHKSRMPDCAFVKLANLDDSTWTVADTLKLVIEHLATAKLQQQLLMIGELRKTLTVDALADTISRMAATTAKN